SLKRQKVLLDRMGREGPAKIVQQINVIYPVEGLQRSLNSMGNITDTNISSQINQALKSVVNNMNGLKREQKNLEEAAANAAMNASGVIEPKTKGGINLSNEHLTMNIKVDGAGMPLPPQYQDKA